MFFEINHLLFTQFIESDFETQRFAMKHLLNVFHDSLRGFVSMGLMGSLEPINSG